MISFPFDAEWLETDGLGGFAMSTVSLVRTRRYHALFCPAQRPPTNRTLLVNGLEMEVITPEGSLPLSTQHYAGDVYHPAGREVLSDFQFNPWPTWRWTLGHWGTIEMSFFLVHGKQEAVLSWKLLGQDRHDLSLRIRPLLSGRDFHSLHFENEALAPTPSMSAHSFVWSLYPDLLPLCATTSGDYTQAPLWYRRFHYAEEKARGFDAEEDLFSPGHFDYPLQHGTANLVFSTSPLSRDAWTHASLAEEAERARRSRFSSDLARHADAYLVARGQGQTIIAGYPWFGDWGRDTFIAMRGLCLTSGRLNEAGQILNEWANHVHAGLLPNRFPDHNEAPEYHSVDAALWFVIVAGEYIAKAPEACHEKLWNAIESILNHYYRGTRHGIKADERDGLITWHSPGLQLTWMDAKCGDWVVTPRQGKPVEIQALWINALRLAQDKYPRFKVIADQATESFHRRFWNEATGGLYDVIDVDGIDGNNDPSWRPNQIFALGGLPFALIEGEKATLMLRNIEATLLTPLGLRTLGSDAPCFRPTYEGGPLERDSGYHQGTVWPWLIGAFIEAWLRQRDFSPEAKAEAHQRFLAPLTQHLSTAGLGHLSEITDATAPFTPKGCPFQAWSIGEYLRALALIETSSKVPD